MKPLKYLTLEYIRSHSRIDYDCENEIIEKYAAAAENSILRLLNRTIDDLMEANGGEVPDEVMVATMELTDNLIRHRSPIEQTALSVVPYNFDLMLRPHMVL
jgi:hypothetical protein